MVVTVRDGVSDSLAVASCSESAEDGSSKQGREASTRFRVCDGARAEGKEPSHRRRSIHARPVQCAVARSLPRRAAPPSRSEAVGALLAAAVAGSDVAAVSLGGLGLGEDSEEELDLADVERDADALCQRRHEL
eukprot:1093796-Rhodomonas_salina.2